MLNSPTGCDHFEWIDDSICDKVRSMAVSLIVSDESLLEENQQLQRLKEEVTYNKDDVKRVREKNSRLNMENSRLKMQLLHYQMRERKELLLLFVVLIGIGFVVGVRK